MRKIYRMACLVFLGLGGCQSEKAVELSEVRDDAVFKKYSATTRGSDKLVRYEATFHAGRPGGAMVWLTEPSEVFVNGKAMQPPERVDEKGKKKPDVDPVYTSRQRNNPWITGATFNWVRSDKTSEIYEATPADVAEIALVDGKRQFLPGETIVLSLKRKPVDRELLKGKGPEKVTRREHLVWINEDDDDRKIFRSIFHQIAYREEGARIIVEASVPKDQKPTWMALMFVSEGVHHFEHGSYSAIHESRPVRVLVGRE